MTTSVIEPVARACGVAFVKDSLVLSLTDGRKVSVPLAWYPRLLLGTRAERERHELIGRGQGIHWPALDEDISVEGVLAGRASQENRQSVNAWIEGRRGQRTRPVVAERRAAYGKRKKA